MRRFIGENGIGVGIFVLNLFIGCFYREDYMWYVFFRNSLLKFLYNGW